MGHDFYTNAINRLNKNIVAVKKSNFPAQQKQDLLSIYEKQRDEYRSKRKSFFKKPTF